MTLSLRRVAAIPLALAPLLAACGPPQQTEQTATSVDTSRAASRTPAGASDAARRRRGTSFDTTRRDSVIDIDPRDPRRQIPVVRDTTRRP